MTMQISEPTAMNPADDSYNAGYFDGELDAISKLPARTAMARVSMADQYDQLWADGYADGYLHQIQVTYALARKQDA